MSRNCQIPPVVSSPSERHIAAFWNHFMGYRKLLKSYMHHVDAVLGADLVEVAAMTNALGKREIGELRAIAAEIKRESFADDDETNYDHIVRDMLQDGRIRADQLAGIDGLEVGDENEDLSPEAFRRILLTLLRFSAQDDEQDDDAENDEIKEADQVTTQIHEAPDQPDGA